MNALAAIATVPERADILAQAWGSLEGQCRVEIYQNDAWGSLPGDFGKFHWLGKADCDFYLSCDDDLLYPPDYVEVMCTAAEEYDAAVT